MGYAMDIEAIRKDWVGRVIDGKYTLLQWLGGSEWSGVFLTELPGPPAQKAAIKLILADDKDAEAYIADWAVTISLSHPHLVRLLDTGRCQTDTVSLLYAVTEYADEILAQILPERPLTPVETGEMLDPVLDALTYLHSRGFVHGHVKPANILVVGDQLKLSSDSLQVAGERGRRLGTLSVYDAPEVATEMISPSADLWSLGVTMVEALTQAPAVWDRSTQKDPIVPESVPEPFAGMVQDCLQADPERRCNLSNLKARLGAAQSAPSAPRRAGRALTKKFRVTAIAAAVLVLIAVLAALQLRSHRIESAFQTVDRLVTGRPSAVHATQGSAGATVKGAVARQVMPDVSDEASETIQGQVDVRVRVTVNPNGDVSNAAFDAPPSSRYFSNLALQAARSWKFKPAYVGGQAVPSVWVLRFQFRRTTRGVTYAETAP